MLQRIQTIWLFLAAVCAFASLKLPFYSGIRITDNTNVRLDGSLYFPIMLLTIAIGVLAMINIFMYSNRKLQFRLCLLGIVLEVGLLFLYFKQISLLKDGTYALSSILQLGVLFFLLAASKGIKNDDRIIRESNRLR